MFRDRLDAGCRLAEVLRPRDWTRPLVLALPRGGVPVASPVAEALQAELDVLVARKIGAPGQPELGIGAVAEGALEPVWGPTASRLRLSPRRRDELVAQERREVERRVAAYRSGRPAPDPAGRDVVLVDDGLATGITAEAALRSLRHRGASTVVLAVPVGAPDTVARLGVLASAVCCLERPDDLVAVGAWYRDFRQVGDAEVRELLVRARRRTGGAG